MVESSLKDDEGAEAIHWEDEGGETKSGNGQN
jgi:hypothetical protein